MTEETATPTQSIRKFHAEGGPRRPSGEPVWLTGVRRRAFEHFRETALPERKMEAWKNISLDYLLDTPFVFSVVSAAAAVGKVASLSSLSESLGGVYRLVIAGGRCAGNLSETAGLPDGAVMTDLMAALASRPERWRPYLEKNAKTACGPFGDLNTLGFTGGALIYLPEGCKLNLPAHLLLTHSLRSSSPALICGKILIVLEKSAELTLVSTHENESGTEALLNWTADVSLAENAKLKWIDVLRDTASAYGILNLNARLERAAELNMISLSGGEVRARYQTNVAFEGEEASVDLKGLLFLTGNSQRSDVINVFHQASHCVSRQLYKNILAGTAQAEYNSLVHVAEGTAGSDADQLNRSIILSDGARAYSRPQLKIDADEVKASHGSATGQLQEEEIFYLRSRGLSPEEAEFALTYGFAQEILSEVGIPGLRDYLEKWAAENLHRMAAAMEGKGVTRE